VAATRVTASLSDSRLHATNCAGCDTEKRFFYAGEARRVVVTPHVAERLSRQNAADREYRTRCAAHDLLRCRSKQRESTTAVPVNVRVIATGQHRRKLGGLFDTNRAQRPARGP